MGGPAALRHAGPGPDSDWVIRASLCLNNHGVHLLARGRYREAIEVLEDAIHVLKSSGRAVPEGPLARVLRRKLERAQRYSSARCPPAAAAAAAAPAPRHLVHVIASEDCLWRLGRLDVLAHISLPAFRLETHDSDGDGNLDYTSALLVHNLALGRIGLGQYDAAARLLALSLRLLERCPRHRAAAAPRAARAAVLGLGALQRCYGELGAAEALRDCRDRLRRLRGALEEGAAPAAGSQAHALAAAA